MLWIDARPACYLQLHSETRWTGMQDVFHEIYATNAWGGADSRSGTGSDLVQTARIMRLLPVVVRELGIRSLLDIPCGDYHWMRHCPLDLDLYIGADIVEPLIERLRSEHADDRHRFERLDLTADPLPRTDLVFCRDALVHMSYDAIGAALANVKRGGARYLMTTTFHARPTNFDIPNGKWRALNLQAEPFGLPEPLWLIDEMCSEGQGKFADKSLGLWRTEDLPG